MSERQDSKDRNNPGGKMGRTVKPIPWPEGLSDKARQVIRHFDGSMYLYRHLGKWVIFDEAEWDIEPDTGDWDASRFEFDREKDIGPWLEKIWEDLKEEGEL